MEKNSIQHIINYKNYLEREIISMENKLKDYSVEFENVKTFIFNNCKHEWINDNIDQMEGYRLSVPIKYCNKCCLTDNTT